MSRVSSCLMSAGGLCDVGQWAEGELAGTSYLVKNARVKSLWFSNLNDDSRYL